MGGNRLFRTLFVLFLVVIAVRALFPTLVISFDMKGFKKPEFLPSFLVKKDDKGKVLYERNEKGDLVRDEDGKKIPVFVKDKNSHLCVQEKNKKQETVYLMVPKKDTNGNVVKDKKGQPVLEKASMTDAIWERCYLPGWYKYLIPYKKKLKLGLDLQGGTHLVLQVDVKKALIHKSTRLADDVARYLKDKGLLKEDAKNKKADVLVLPSSDEPQIDISVEDEKKVSSIRSKIEDHWSYLNVRIGKTNKDLVLTYKKDEVKRAQDAAVTQALEIIRNRVDSLGVSEPSISRYGDSQIVIQLPGLKNPAKAKELIGKTAVLTFHVVEDDAQESADIFNEMKGDKDKPKEIKDSVSSYRRNQANLPQGRSAIGTDRLFYHDSREVLDKWIKKWNKKIAKKYNRKYKLYVSEFNSTDNDDDDNKSKKKLSWRTYLLWRVASLSGEDLEEARPQIDSQANQPEVGLKFNLKGGDLFEYMTKEHVGHRFAIVLEGKVHSAPVIEGRIGGGTARITMGGLKSYQESMDDAKDLSFVLKSGSLPAPVDILYEKTIGPGLGKDSIDRGVRSLMIGFLLVVFFIFLYYRGSGINANIALSLNIIFVMSLMSSFGATLTLPGMAGIVLTIGMAVDANILIFERIREELLAGKTVRIAIQQGYDKAFVTILDANITTGIAGIVLYQYGSGPVRGFAVTMLIGIFCSVFTALFVTKLVYAFVLGSKNKETLSI